MKDMFFRLGYKLKSKHNSRIKLKLFKLGYDELDVYGILYILYDYGFVQLCLREEGCF